MRRPVAVAALGVLACILGASLASAACPGARPGAIVMVRGGACTLDFLFEAPSGRRYVGTAGHCVLGGSPLGSEDRGHRSWRGATGPVARDGSGARIGTVAWAIREGERDFALIRLDRGVEPAPRVCGVGGPTGIDDRLVTAPVRLSFYGNGLGLGTLAPARSLVALGMPDRDRVHAWGVATFGDSGAPVIGPDGRAVGVIVTLGIHTGSGLDWGLVGITRIAPEIERAEAALGRDLRLVTA